MAPRQFPSLVRLAGLVVAMAILAASGASDAGQPVRRTGFDIQRFELAGADPLPESVLQACVADAVGTNVPLPRVRAALERIQRAYQDAGYPETTVTIHKQVITNGTAVVSVSLGERTSPTVKSASSAATTSPTQAPKAPPRTFEVRSYRVEGNTLIPNEALERILSPATGTNVTLAAIQKAVGNLQLAYRERGFATVGVALPQQQITNASVRVVVNEGLLTDVRVTGNHYFSSNNVLRALPSLKTNQVLNGRVFQRELDLANQVRDRQIYPTLGPGPEPGASALELRVKDRLPLHGRLEVNNQSTPGTPEWRINGSLQYNNLWQREHQLGLSAGFTPEELKSGDIATDYFFNRPLIAYYGTYYRLPFGSPESVQERIDGSTKFGYDESTHQFRLPPAQARPDLTVYATVSSSDTGVKYGPASTVARNSMSTIISQDTGRNLSVNENLGARLSFPLLSRENSRLSLSGGLDAKRYFLQSHNTNNFDVTSTITNASGSVTIRTNVPSPQPAYRSQAIYLPLNASLDYSETDSRGNFGASLSATYNVLGQDSSFHQLAYTTKADPGFGKLGLYVTREQRVGGEWSLFLRASGQVATGALLSGEQFALGGVNSVRGYYEGDDYGDHAWFASAEWRTPFLRTRVPTSGEYLPVWLRGFTFVDLGQRFLEEAAGSQPSTRTLVGAGFGVSASLNNTLDLRIALGWPLTDSANTHSGDPRATISLGGQF